MQWGPDPALGRGGQSSHTPLPVGPPWERLEGGGSEHGGSPDSERGGSPDSGARWT